MNMPSSLFGPMRVPFLVLAPACAAVGIGTAHWQTQQVHWLHAVLVILGAVAAHVSVNAFNEYFDFTSGLDARTQRTPFSGGSGTLPANPELRGTALIIASTALLIAAAIGIYFVWLRGWQLLPVGVLGLALLVTYTLWWVRHPILSLVAPGLGFGILMVMGTHFALTGDYTWTSLIASLVPTFLVSNLLLLNQFPDVEADQTVGRRHFPILIGRQASAVLYGLLLLGSYLSVVAGVLLNLLPALSLLTLLTVILAWRAYRGARQHAEDIPALIPALGLNVIVTVVTPILLAVGLFLG
jgi:1,4-dihydroxy-2-naphthoate octaprenyltransferase